MPVIDVFMQYALPLGVRGPARKPVITIGAPEADVAEAQLENAGAPAGGAPRIGVHPGGKWAVKRWPARHFAELVDMIVAAGARPVLFTGPDEPEATNEVVGLVRTPAARLDALDIRTTAAIISRLDAMIACDGGVMHTSVAVGTPTVGIFGSSQSAVWFPYESSGPYRAAEIDVPCRPCHQHVCPLGHTRCLNELLPAHVASLLKSIVRTDTRLAT
jgi:heptosyltransferase-2